MALTSVQFLIFCLATLIVFRLCPFPRIRLIVLLLANLIFFFSLLNALTEGWFLASFAVLSYICVQIVYLRRSNLMITATVSAILIVFVFVKYFTGTELQRALPIYSIVGLSYILFRAIHLIVDLGHRELERKPDFLEFITFLFYFPAFLSGPVNRYELFPESVYLCRPLSYQEKETSLVRILRGLTKVMIVAPALQQFFYFFSKNAIAGAPATVLRVPFSVAALAATSPTIGLPACVASASAIYFIYLYFNFAGYTDFAIGVSGLFGISLPENFNKPFKSANFSEFWSRWHMSLADWFKTYVFTPLVRIVTNRLPARGQTTLVACLCLFISFVLIGLWHGSTLVFVYFGLYLGSAAAGHKLYQQAMISVFGKKAFKSLTENRYYSFLCRCQTFAYFAGALTCFWLSAEEIVLLITRLSVLGLLSVHLVLIAIAAVGLWLSDTVSYGMARFKSLSVDSGLLRSEQLEMAFQCFVVVAFAVLFNSAPTFVYQGF